jgi:hypothetical protein
VKLEELEFTAEDFDSELKEWVSGIALTEECNRILREKLEKAPKVWREFDRWTTMPPEHQNFRASPLQATHTARLVCIEKLKEQGE